MANHPTTRPAPDPAPGTGSISALRYPLLIVDDDLTVRLLIKGMADSSGWKVLEAKDGLEALEIVEASETPLVILLDINMPKMNGLEVLKRLDKKKCRAVMMTGDTDVLTVREAFISGAVDYVLKPFKDWDALKSMLKKAEMHLLLEEHKAERDKLLEEKAEWQDWKAKFLGATDKSGMEQVLDMLHVQFNQDQNYPVIAGALSSRDEGVSKQTMSVLKQGLSSVARFSEGISIAKRVTSSFPVFRTIPLPEVKDWFRELRSKHFDAVTNIHNHDLTLSIDLPQDAANGYLHVDRSLFDTVLQELVINACKYSDPEDPIDISVGREGQWLNILITNPARKTTRLYDGSMTDGIPKELTGMALKYFVRFSIDTTAQYPEQWPMGLGLALAHATIERHGGTISIANETWHMSRGHLAAPFAMVACRLRLPILNHPAKDPAPEAQEDEDDDNFELF